MSRKTKKEEALKKSSAQVNAKSVTAKPHPTVTQNLEPKKWIARVDNQFNATPEKGPKYLTMYPAGTILVSLNRPNNHWDEYIDEVEQRRRMLSDLEEIGQEVDPDITDDDLAHIHKRHMTEMQMSRVRTSFLQEKMIHGE